MKAFFNNVKRVIKNFNEYRSILKVIKSEPGSVIIRTIDYVTYLGIVTYPPLLFPYANFDKDNQ